MKLEPKLWRSRVARRVFLLFLACSFVPLIVEAMLARHMIEQQLIEMADERLARTSRAAQMSIVQAIQQLDTKLGIVTEELERGGEVGGALRSQLESEFSGLSVTAGDGSQTVLLGSPDPQPPFSEKQIAFLDEGGTLLTLAGEPGQEAPIFMTRAITGKGPGRSFLSATVNTERIWKAQHLAEADSHVLIMDSAGRVVYSTISGKPLQECLILAGTIEAHGEAIRWTLAGDTFIGSHRVVFMMPQFMTNWAVLYTQSEAQVLAPVRHFRKVFLLVIALTFWAVLLVSVIQIQRLLNPIEELQAGTHRIANRDFSQPVEVDSNDEFWELAESFNSMSTRLDHYIAAADELHSIGLAFEVENDSSKVIRLIAESAMRVLKADSVTLMLSTESGDLQGAYIETGVPVTDAELANPAPLDSSMFGCTPPRSLAALAVQERHAIVSWELSSEEVANLADDQAFEGAQGIAPQHAMAVSMRNHEGELIGTLQVGRNKAKAGIHVFGEEERRLFEALSAQGALALTKNHLIEGMRNMMMSMTEIFAMAVDEKSAYTGAHCRRVPDLTMWLAESAEKATTGSLAEFNPTEAEVFELKVAALLHDCGKVVTPTHIMDKATKLETIYDRIGLLDQRIETIDRDMRLAYLQQEHEAGSHSLDPTALPEELAQRLTELRDDQAFLRFCNKGSENMSDADCDRVRSIASKYRLQDTAGQAVPLLNDEELENLTIKYGTLTAGERKIINEHINITIQMLEGLDYPKGLRQVPKLAGAHHERMDGKGYPFGLTRSEIPVGGRIMGIADVFEAVTDGDRPYKEAKSLQESLEILGRMAATGHLDQELFQLFIDDEVYLRFAYVHMAPERIRPVDFSKIQGCRPPDKMPNIPGQREQRAA